jgi:HD-GYP domain-containing protein (c-di-GMP phosphodiesterase class II)
MQKSYLPIQTLDIGAETKLGFDLYVNLPLNNKMILYCRKGAQVETGRLEKLANLNLSNFYIRGEEYHDFVKYVAVRIKNLVGSENSEINLKIMKATAKAILSSTFNQEDPATINALMQNLNDIAAAIIDGVLETSGRYNRRTFMKLAELAEGGSDFQKHPVNVSSLAVLICFGIGYNSPRSLADAAMGALLHDVGLTKLPTNVITKAHDPMDLPIAQRELLYNHPRLAIEVLNERGVRLNDTIKTMILQHHEQFNGTGYPVGLRGFQLHEMSMVLRVADELDRLVSAGSSGRRSLKLRVTELFDYLQQSRVIDPVLLTRIRSVIL